LQASFCNGYKKCGKWKPGGLEERYYWLLCPSLRSDISWIHWRHLWN